MKIAPIDIAHKTFARKVMGLDADEVSDFLRECADQMEEIIRERNALKEMIRQRDLQIMEFKERDEGLKATIQTATKMSEQIRVDSEREAKLIIGDAHQKAELILKDSRDSLKRVYQEIADIKRLRMQFEVNMRSLVQAHIAMLDQGHYVMPDPQINLAHAMSTTTNHTQSSVGSSIGAAVGPTMAAAPAPGAAPAPMHSPAHSPTHSPVHGSVHGSVHGATQMRPQANSLGFNGGINAGFSPSGPQSIPRS